MSHGLLITLKVKGHPANDRPKSGDAISGLSASSALAQSAKKVRSFRPKARYLSPFRKLARVNKAAPDPHWLDVFLFHSHPPIAQRLVLGDGEWPPSRTGFLTYV